jgi:GT2 family glycosyltransferase
MVGIVILNWNGLDDTLRCLKSLEQTKNSAIKREIVLIDNGSTADPADQIRRDFPDVDFVRLESNIGYAAGCNLGAKRMLARGADFILFLNNDTISSASFLDELIKDFDADHSIGIASPLIREISNPERIDFAGGHINFALGTFQHERRGPASLAPFETDYVSGCCMIVSRAAIEQVGLFDEKLFAYFEDVDLCLRAQRAGFKTVCVPGVTVRHKGSASTQRELTQGTTSPLKHYLIARNRVVIVNRYAPSLAKSFYHIVAGPLRTAFYTIAFIVRGRWSKLRWFWRGVVDGISGKLEMPAELTR